MIQVVKLRGPGLAFTGLIGAGVGTGLNKNYHCLESNFLDSNFFKKISGFLLYLLFYICFTACFGTVAHAAAPEDILEHLKNMIESFQNEISSIDAEMEEAGLNKDNSELTPEQLENKQKYQEARKESVEDRNLYTKDYSEAKAESQPQNAAGEKRQHDNLGEGSLNKRGR